MTARTAVGADEDELVLLAALSVAGADAQVVPWDDPVADWGEYDLAVVRSTWDYSWRPATKCGYSLATASWS